jgi:alpha-galactosidase
MVKRLSRFVPLAALADQVYSPLVVHMVREYGIVPCSVDSHIGEYLPFALDIAGDHFAPVDYFDQLDRFVERLAIWATTTHTPVPFHRVGHSLEEVIPIVAAMWTGTPVRLMAVNVPNRGYLPNVVNGAIVEVGATVNGDGIHPDTMPPVVDPITGHIATQVALQDLVVESALTSDPELALQAITEDANSPADKRACRAIFDELSALQSADLPF